MSRPLLKPFVIWSRPGDDIGVFQGGGLNVFLRGEDTLAAVEALLPQLTGVPLEEAAERAGLDLEDAEAIVGALRKRKVVDDLDDDDGAADAPHADALRAFSHAPRTAAAQLASATVSVLGTGRTAEIIAQLLGASGVGQVTRALASDAACAIYAEDAPSADGVREAQRAAAGRPFLAVRVDASAAWIGPTVVPGHACNACFEARAQNMSTVPGVVAARRIALDAHAPQPAALPALIHAAAAQAVFEAVLIASGSRAPTLLDAAIVVGTAHRRHPVLPVPGCPDCEATS